MRKRVGEKRTSAPTQKCSSPNRNEEDQGTGVPRTGRSRGHGRSQGGGLLASIPKASQASVPRWLQHGGAHECLPGADSPNNSVGSTSCRRGTGPIPARFPPRNLGDVGSTAENRVTSRRIVGTSERIRRPTTLIRSGQWTETVKTDGDKTERERQQLWQAKKS